MDSKVGSWRQSGGLSQPAWLFHRKASPFFLTGGAKRIEEIRSSFFLEQVLGPKFLPPPVGLERRLLETVRWTVSTAVAFPQKSESMS